MEAHVLSLLTGALTADVAWGPLPQDADMPRVSLMKVSGATDFTLDGPGLVTARVQIDAYAVSYSEALSIARTIRGELNGYQGGSIRGAFLEVMRDGIEGDADLVHRATMTFAITYQED